MNLVKQWTFLVLTEYLDDFAKRERQDASVKQFFHLSIERWPYIQLSEDYWDCNYSRFSQMALLVGVETPASSTWPHLSDWREKEQYLKRYRWNQVLDLLHIFMIRSLAVLSLIKFMPVRILVLLLCDVIRSCYNPHLINLKSMMVTSTMNKPKNFWLHLLSHQIVSPEITLQL